MSDKVTTDMTVFGLQRSGTNFLEQLIRRNMNGATVINTWAKGIWKHIYDIENNTPFSDDNSNLKRRILGHWGGQYKYDLLLQQKILPIYIHKHPYSWLESIVNKSVDITKVYPQISENQTKNTYFQFENVNLISATKLWQAHTKYWYSKKQKDLFPIYILSYENLIRDEASTRHHVDAIATFFGKTCKPTKQNLPIDIPEKVGQSDKFTEEKRQRYNEVRVTHFSWKHIQEINKHLDRNFVRNICGYTLWNNEETYWKHKKPIVINKDDKQ